MQQTKLSLVHSSNDRPAITKESMTDFSIAVLFEDLFPKSYTVFILSTRELWTRKTPWLCQQKM